MRTRTLAALSLSIAATLAPVIVPAQSFPSKTVTLVTNVGPGGPQDADARAIAQFFQSSLGGPVVVENRPGADGRIACEAVVKAAPDGHTLYYTGAGITTLAILFLEPRCDPLKDLVPVSRMIDQPSGFITNGQLPVRNIDEFIAHARANPGTLNYATVAPTQKLVVAALMRATGIQMTEVGYKSGPDVHVAMFQNQIHLYNNPLNQPLKAQVDAGKLRPLLMVGNRRARVFPDIPTAADRGWNIPSNAWAGLFATASTPRPVVERLAAEAAKFAASADTQKRAQDLGMEIGASTPEQFRQTIESDSRTWAEIAASIGMKRQ